MRKTVVISGASRGIGRMCALKFSEHGYNVAVNYCRGKEAAEETAALVRKNGVDAEIYQADTSDAEAVKEMFGKIKKDFGSVDVLINNAGITDDAYILSLDESSVSRCLDVNVKGYLNCIQQAALKMISKKSGTIINMSSVSGSYAIPGQSVYSATKAAVNALTKVAAKELARYGIRVNAIAPGFVNTDMIKEIPDDKMADHAKNIPLGRLAEPEDIAMCALRLCGEGFEYMTGQVLILDGGLSL